MKIGYDIGAADFADADDGTAEAEMQWQAKVDANADDPKGVRIAWQERDRWLDWRCPGFERWAPTGDAGKYGNRTLFDDPPPASAVDAEPSSGRR